MQHHPTDQLAEGNPIRIQIEKPRRAIPITLIVDDPAPSINPLYYYRLQVDNKNYEQHVREIPFNFLEQFIAVCQRHGTRGKFSILPYPAGLGSILEGWDGCDLAEIQRWLDLVRTHLVPNFDITPEILTHTRSLDIETGTLYDQSEQAWMADQDLTTLTSYMSAATKILHAAGFVSSGITQPVSFSGSRADYTRATLEAVRAVGGPSVTFHFIDEHTAGPPFWEPEAVWLDRERGEAVVDIGNTCPDFCWFTQQPHNRQAQETADRFISPDGTTGHLIDLIAADAWLITVCHWQSIYSDGSRAGLLALDEVWDRLTRHIGPRLLWMTTGEIAQYQAATAGCEITAQMSDNGIIIDLDAAFACPDFTLSLHLPTDSRWTCVDVTHGTTQGRMEQLRQGIPDAPLLNIDSWIPIENGLTLCIPLERGRQQLYLT